MDFPAIVCDPMRSKPSITHEFPDYVTDQWEELFDKAGL